MEHAPHFSAEARAGPARGATPKQGGATGPTSDPDLGFGPGASDTAEGTTGVVVEEAGASPEGAAHETTTKKDHVVAVVWGGEGQESRGRWRRRLSEAAAAGVRRCGRGPSGRPQGATRGRE